MFTARYRKTVPHAGTLLLLALLAGLVASTSLASDQKIQPSKPPELLPADLRDAAQPLCVAANGLQPDALWKTIEILDAGHFEDDDAIVMWRRITLPSEHEVWRHVALGVIYLCSERPNDAENELAFARELRPKNAAVHYFTGLLRLEQAEMAQNYPDAVRLASGVRQVRQASGSLSTPGYDDKPRSPYELEAINELELAIRSADGLDLGLPLTPVVQVISVPYPPIETHAAPTIADLLRACGAENFVGKAHGLLAYLYLDHGLPVAAEKHVDEASSHGIPVPYGHRLVGELYDHLGRGSDAHRALKKAKESGDLLAKPGATPSQNMARAFENLF